MVVSTRVGRRIWFVLHPSSLEDNDGIVVYGIVVYEPSSGMDDPPPTAALLLEDVLVSLLVISAAAGGLNGVIVSDIEVYEEW